MSAPVGHTCPLIDRVIEALEEASNSLTSLDGDGDVISELDRCMDVCEEIRDANSELRDWGYAMESEYECMRAERDDAESEKAEAEDEVERCEARIEDLEAQIHDLQQMQYELHDKLDEEVNRPWTISLRRHTSQFFSLYLRLQHSPLV